MYLYLYYERCLLIKRVYKISTAVISSAAIAAWVTTANYEVIWGGIIVASQVASAVYEVLPISKRIDSLSSLVYQLEPLYNEVEEIWNSININDNKYTDDEILGIAHGYVEKWITLSNKAFPGDAVPQSKRLTKLATEQATAYIKRELGGQ